MAEWFVFVVGCLQGRIFICTSRFKLHLRPFPEASKHIGDELPSLPPDKTCFDIFADFSSANGEDLWTSVDEKIVFVLTRSASGGARLGNLGRKCSHCIQVGGQSESALLIRKHFRKAKLGSRKGRGIQMFYCYPSQCLIWPPYLGRRSGEEPFSQQWATNRGAKTTRAFASLPCLWHFLLSTCHLDFDGTYPILVHMACQYPRRTNTSPLLFIIDINRFRVNAGNLQPQFET